jgi:ATP-binding cassette subfamily B (MDR/TAP) protein 1
MCPPRSHDGKVVVVTVEDASAKQPSPAESASPKEIAGANRRQSSFRGMYRYATLYDLRLLTLGTAALFVSGANQPLQLVVFGRLMDSFNGSDDANVVKANVHFFAMWYALLGVQQLCTNSVQTSCFATVAARQARQMRHRYFEALARRSVAYFDAADAGALAASVMEKSTHVQTGLGDDLAQLVQRVLAFVIGLGVAAYFSWRLTLVSFAAVPILGLVVLAANAAFAKASSGSAALLDAAAATPNEAIGAIRTVQAFGREVDTLAKYRALCEGAAAQGVAQGRARAALEAATAPIMFVMFGSCLWYGAELVAADMESSPACRLVSPLGKAQSPDPELCTTGGSVLTAFLSVIFGFMGLLQAIPSLSTLSAARSSAAAIFETIDADAGPTDPLAAAAEGVGGRAAGALEVRDVVFAYPARSEVRIYDGLRLSIGAGQTVALAGPSGCGKSTLVALLERWYDVDGGAVLLDGVDVRDVSVAWLRSQVGLVSQEPVLFSGTIGWNIGLGAAAGRVQGGTADGEGTYGLCGEEAVVSAARLSNAHTFISEFPEGYATPVGEKGVQLSGGQKQRIAIARALVREPAVLVLDEATSALDAESERVVQGALDELLRNSVRTTIVIAHRLSTIRHADKIAVLSGGRVAEEGPHDELLEREGGIYRSLVIHSQGSNAN